MDGLLFCFFLFVEERMTNRFEFLFITCLTLKIEILVQFIELCSQLAWYVGSMSLAKSC